MTLKPILDVVRTAAVEWYNDGAPRMGAALSFYTVFALAPLVVLVISIASMAFGEQAVKGQLVGQIESLVGRPGAEVVQTVIANADKGGGGVFGTAVGIALLVVSATGVFGELKDSLNRIWEVEPAPAKSYWVSAWNFLRTRLLSFATVMVLAFLLMVSLVISAVLAGATGWVERSLPAPAIVLMVVNWVISFGVITLLFAFVFKTLPDADPRWREVWLGAIVTAVLFNVGKFVIGLYLGRSSFASVYGAAGSLVVVLVWIYYSAQIFMFGAELTAAHAAVYGDGIRPASYARRRPDARKPMHRDPAVPEDKDRDPEKDKVWAEEIKREANRT